MGPLVVHRSARGITLIESVVAALVFGILMAFSIPAVSRLSESHRLKYAAESVAGELRLARERAIATGQLQQMNFTLDGSECNGCAYYIQSGVTVGKTWELPRGISYQSIGVNPRMEPNGRSYAAGLIVLKDTRGLLDTVSVQLSGMVITK